ncbi:hypothetical protein Pint_17485 [Pistacia integerrima]|uniref:Uncharacterized protein n=1 Tax=Pistacia integerrima TaxID=434235 RepID=A0ACC0Z0D3_9ROSI|nr:hypothetical protein Pint_17485 [Pistacia integerrima]
MAMASLVKVILGLIAFAIFWVLAVFPAVPFLPVGRTAGSLLGAMLMVLFQVISPDQAYAAIDLPILGLLFGTMVVSVYLERADMFKYLGKLLSWKSKGPKDLICRICLISAISSALFTNDTSCVVLTEFVLKIARQHNLPPHPFLIALASSANIGSSATPIGNPQNLVIAVQSKISFGKFLIGILPAMLMGVFVNAVIILLMYWKLLSSQKDEEDATADVVAEEDVTSHRFSPATLSHETSLNSQERNTRAESINFQSSPNVNGNIGHVDTLRNRASSIENEIHRVHSGAIGTPGNSNESKEVSTDGSSQRREEAFSPKGVASTIRLSNVSSQQILDGKENLATRWKKILWKSCVYLVTVGMLISLLMGLNMSWTAITAALALVVLDFKDARPSLEKIDHVSGTAVLAVVILVLSNVASNVPTVLLLGGRVAASAAAISAADEKKSWLILAWVSTVAGNLSLLGSAANLIVCEQARRAPHLAYTLSFWNHLKFGVPSTLIVTAIVFPAVPFLPIGRTAGSLLGAALMQGTNMEDQRAKDLICRICLISAITSAFFTNDTTCVALPKIVLNIAQENNLPPLPFLLALASSDNIGSSATAIGNPQNLVIALESKMSFAEFLTSMISATLAGVVVNALVLLCMFWNLLSVKNDESVYSYQFSPAVTSHFTSPNDQERGFVNGNLDHVETTSNRGSSSEHKIHLISRDVWESRNSNFLERWKGKLKKTCFYLILGMLIALLAGQDMSWTTITVALALVVLDFKDAAPCFDKVKIIK